MSNHQTEQFLEAQHEAEQEQEYLEKKKKPFEVIMGIDDFLFNQVKE